MKNNLFAVLALMLVSAFNFQPVTAVAQGTAFTYQGQLQSGGSPASGSYDLMFTLYPTNITGVPIAGPVTNTAVAVTNGLFTTLVNFGPGAFTGTSDWLAVAVSLSGTNNFSVLAPRHLITPTPYALVAASASGLPGLTIQQYGIGVPNYLLGAADNFIAAGVNGATIGGGTNISIGASWSGVGGGYGNSIGAASYVSWLGGGLGNVISSNSTYAVLGGGQNNTIQAYVDHAFIGGGGGNIIQGNANNNTFGIVSYSAIVGGSGNIIGLGVAYSFIGGGVGNAIQASASYSTLSGGAGNSVFGDYNFLGGGVDNIVQGGQEETLVGGQYNTVNAQMAFLGGGIQNTIIVGGYYSTLVGGEFNTAGGYFAAVGGGYQNHATNNYATVPGGSNNVASGVFSFAAGSAAQATNFGAFVWADPESTPFASTNANSFNVRASGGVRFVTGGAGLTVDGQAMMTSLPPAVVTNLETGVTLTNLNVGGSLMLPAMPVINAGSSTFLYADGNDNFFAGLAAGNVTTSGGYNLAVGASALGVNTSGNYNLATGAGALRSNTSGGGNVATGVGVLAVNVTGNNNTAVGNFALQDLGTSGSAGGTNNIALGYLAGFNFLANESGNIDIGSRGAVGENNIIRIGSTQTDIYLTGNVHDTGVFIGNGGGLTNLNLNLSPLPAAVVTNLATGVTLTNLFVGGNLTLPATAAIYAGNNLMIYGDANANFFAGIYAGNVLASGSYNTAVGGSALRSNTSGSGNVAVGLAALSYNLTGNDNTAEGLSALQNLGTSGSAGGTNNIALGYLAGFNFEGNESGNIDIGSWGNAGENNIIRIGSTQTDTYLTGNVHVYGTVSANGVLLTSDRNVKENFTAINAREVLAKVAALPVTEWNYKSDSKAQPHIGPMAQDFQAAFQLGQDDKHISVVDENGVALAAIQGLNQKVEEKDATIQQQAADIADLKARLEKLEQLVSRQLGGAN